MTTPYVPLWCKSNYSFLEGASHPEELIEEAHRLGLTSLGLADRDGVYGMVRAHVKARELGVQLVPGATLTMAASGAVLAPSPVGGTRPAGLHATAEDFVQDAAMSLARRGRVRRAPKRAAAPATKAPSRFGADSSPSSVSAPSSVSSSVSSEPATSVIAVYAIDHEGWRNLTRLITAGRRRAPKGTSLLQWEELAAHARGLIAVWGGDDSLIAGADDATWRKVAALTRSLRDAFGDRLYAMVTRHRRADEVRIETRVRARAAQLAVPIVAGLEVLYHSRSRRPLQDVIACIRAGVQLSKAGRVIRGNDEHDLKTPHRFEQLWADDPGAVERTRQIAARCRFDLGQIRYRYPLEKLPSGATTSEHLRALTWEGARRRFPEGVEHKIARQLEAELALIEELDYGGYFLTMYEIVQFCGRANILCQGRGSAANSAVCYCLGITAVDPTRIELLFERFLSRERAEPPDIDLDIEHERREEVIQHVYRAYGRDHAAMVCNLIRYRAKSAVRDVGKVLGLPETALDRAAKLMSSWGDVEPTALEQVFDGARPGAVEHLARLAKELIEFPRHLSIHPGGFVLGHEPVHDLVPIENATMPGRTVIQWDKDDLEALGLFKVDLLALGALHQLHRCFDLIKEHRDQTLTMATIPADDEPTFDMMCAGDTVGVFQIESRAQMSMLPRLKPRTFYDIVVQVSIVRPGPISGGMVHPYLRRRNGQEAVVYPHPCLEPVLRRTLGVPLFQEQVMKLAVVAADYTPGEADQLRRDMAAWRRSGRILQHRTRLIERMMAKGIDADFAERVFEQIKGFGEYGFPESHAASFALIAYATSYLRRHYLPEFTCSLLNAQPMGFYSAATLVGDAQRHGLEVRPIDVTASAWDCTIERVDDAGDLGVRMGLRYVSGLRLDHGERIARARRERRFGSLEDFVRRVRLEDRAYTGLAESGALRSLMADHTDRRDALWQVRGWARHQDDALSVATDEPDAHFAALTKFETVAWDYRASDHSTRGHPLGPLRNHLRQRGWPDARTVQAGRDGQRVDYVGLVICRQRPYTAAGVTFMTLEDESGFVNLVVWSQVFEQYSLLARTAGLLGISGRLQVQESVVHLIADRLWAPELPRAIETMPSRDFH